MEMLEETIRQYHERRGTLTAEEAGETSGPPSAEITSSATEQALKIMKDMQVDRESFRKIDLTFEENFYDILMMLRDKFNFEYGEDKNRGRHQNQRKCAVWKDKEIIDVKSNVADWAQQSEHP